MARFAIGWRPFIIELQLRQEIIIGFDGFATTIEAFLRFIGRMPKGIVTK
jgi:hypothetical protein